jgi:hypothetical protein
MKLTVSLLVLISFISLSAKSQNLIFKSSFEEGVYLEEPFFDSPDSGTWWQHLRGSDSSGYSWPVNLWGGEGVFQVLVDAELPSSDYIENTLEIIDDADGNPTRVIHQNIKQKAEGFTQDPYIVYTENEEGDLYVRFSIKYEADLEAILGPNGWLTFFEWKTSGDYRIAAYIYEDLENNLYWYVHGDNEANGGLPYEEFWYEENYEVEVPQGEWFTLEFFWHRSTGNDGRFWWAMNGNIIADHIGPNKDIEPIDRIMLFTAYSGSDSINQWVDDVEIWDDFPCGEGIPCFDGSTTAINDISQDEFIEFKASPNPSNKTTSLTYNLSEQANVTIDLYNTHGKRIKNLINQEQSKGLQKVNINLNDLSNGIYFCKLSISNKNYYGKTIKLILTK